MTPRRRGIALAGAAVATLGLAAGGVTYAATGGGSGSGDQAGALADALNASQGTHLTAADIQAAAKTVLKERLDAAVKAGKLTQAQADEILSRAGSGDLHVGPGPFFMGRFGPPPILDPAAKALGISTDALRTQLQSGKSLADIAKAQNVDPSTVIAAVQKALLASPRGKDLTEARAKEIATRIVNATPPGPGARPWGRGHWEGPPPGP